MRAIEVVRWGLPTLIFLGFFRLSGAAVSFVFAAVVFALTSTAITWHRRDPHGFCLGVRAWIIILLIAPAVLLTVATALSAPPFLLASAPYLILTIWLYRRNARCIRKHGSATGPTPNTP